MRRQRAGRQPTTTHDLPVAFVGAPANIGAPGGLPGRQDWWRSKLGNQISLTASDGFKLGGYRADPAGTPKGGLVVIQEIFGVNHHIRNVCDRFAALGYASVAPAVFDRMTANFEWRYSPDEMQDARGFMPKGDWAAMMRATAAAIDAVKGSGK